VEDAPPTLGTDLGGPESPTNHLWKEPERDTLEPSTPEPKIELPTPTDNPGGPPPAPRLMRADSPLANC
jgi:hypothetical protein